MTSIQQSNPNDCSDFQNFGPVKFSYRGIKKLMTPIQIVYLYRQIKDNLENNGAENQEQILQLIPYQVFAHIVQYDCKKFKPRQNTDLDIQDYFFEDHFKVYELPKTKMNIYDLCPIKFNHLKILNLSSQFITSIEALTHITAPRLACLELYNNQITNMEPLVKANFQQLRVITFYQNPVSKMDQFYRIKNKRLKKYEFDVDKKCDHLLEDYRFLPKMQNTALQRINLINNNRIQLINKPMFKLLSSQNTKIEFSSRLDQIPIRPLGQMVAEMQQSRYHMLFD